jgi:hypothetical protein
MAPDGRSDLAPEVIYVGDSYAALLVAFSHCSNAKMRFQSFFMLITVQPFFFASS